MEVTQGVHLIPGVKMSRVYLIEDKTLTLVDTGFPWDVRRILKYIVSIGRRPEDIGHILMTHNHPDHTSGGLGISKRTGAEIVAHQHDTKANSDNRQSLGHMKVFGGLEVPLPFFRHTPVAHLVSENDVPSYLSHIRVIHTPGHTPGSVCYLLEDRGVLFSGDTIFSNGNRVSRSIPFPGYNADDYRESLRKLGEMQFDSLCGGHGSPLVGGASDRLRELLRAKPELPSWGELLFKRIPRRLLQAKNPSGEDD